MLKHLYTLMVFYCLGMLIYIACATHITALSYKC